jgi:hypothetical protein
MALQKNSLIHIDTVSRILLLHLKDFSIFYVFFYKGYIQNNIFCQKKHFGENFVMIGIDVKRMYFIDMGSNDIPISVQNFCVKYYEKCFGKYFEKYTSTVKVTYLHEILSRIVSLGKKLDEVWTYGTSVSH